jgi:hypothetical protein
MRNAFCFGNNLKGVHIALLIILGYDEICLIDLARVGRVAETLSGPTIF